MKRSVTLFVPLTLIGLFAGCSKFASEETPPENRASADAGDVDGRADGSVPSPDGGPTGLGAPLDFAAVAVPVVSDVTTLAGGGNAGFAEGMGDAARFSSPHGVAAEPAGSLYVADGFNSRIRRVTSAGLVTTLAGGAFGSADGTGAAAQFELPYGVNVDGAGNVYVADLGAHRIRRITAAGVVTTLAGSGTATFADGTGVSASFYEPSGVVIDPTGNVYVSDKKNNRIRRVTPAGVVTTLAGSGMKAFADGTGVAASLNDPSGIVLDLVGNLYFADAGNNRIRKVTPAGVVTTLAGSYDAGSVDGSGVAARFDYPIGLALDAAGNLYVSGVENRIRRVTAAGVVTTLAGSGRREFADGKGTAASFGCPFGLALDAAANLYVADTCNHRIRKVTTVGIGELATSWKANAGTSSITGYVASASAPGQPTKTCTSTGSTSCTIKGLTTGIAYTVSVTATDSAQRTSPSSNGVTATPN